MRSETVVDVSVPELTSELTPASTSQSTSEPPSEPPSEPSLERSSACWSRRAFLATAAAGVAGVAVTPAVAAAASPTAGDRRVAHAAESPRRAYWPDGARLVISISMQFEAGAQDAQATAPGFPPLPPQYADTIVPSWYAYGMREGIPRLLDLWDRYGVKVTSHMVGRAVELQPQLAREVVERGHEASGHGQTWTPQYAMSPDEERAAYLASIASLHAATGTRPLGFNAFWMRQTPQTLSILQSLGFIYHIDDLQADEPLLRRVNGQPFVVVPYTARNNDIVRYDSPALTASAFAQELKSEFDVLYAEAAQRRRLMSISTHDRISGQPAKTQALAEFIAYAQRHPGVVFWRKDQIARWILTQDEVPWSA